MTYLLAIESSCDDTAAAVLHNNEVLSSVISSQMIHSEFSGVVPELASRKHMELILSVTGKALRDANVPLQKIEVIAATQGPGLVGSLLVGFSFAKGLALARNLPFVAVSHLQGHLLSPKLANPELQYPYLVLTASGGHSMISIVHSPTRYSHIGKTIDDAAGEAFDKGAVLLGLGYPGGPVIDKLAQKGNPRKFQFPVANIQGFNFSFSGLKTSLLYFLQRNSRENPDFISQNLHDIAASYQHAIVEQLLQKLRKALEKFPIKHVALAGGVSANSYLREKFQELTRETQTQGFLVPLKYCMDNAAMIGFAAYEKYKQGIISPLNSNVFAREEIYVEESR